MAAAVSRAASRVLGRVVSDCPLFTMQLTVSAVGMALSATMLAMGRDPAVYLPVLTSIIGYWLPAPKRPPEPFPLAPAESVASVNNNYRRPSRDTAAEN